MTNPIQQQYKLGLEGLKERDKEILSVEALPKEHQARRREEGGGEPFSLSK